MDLNFALVNTSTPCFDFDPEAETDFLGTSGHAGFYLHSWLGTLMTVICTSFIVWSIPRAIVCKRSAVPYSPHVPKAPVIFNIQTRLTQFMIGLIGALELHSCSSSSLQFVAWLAAYFLTRLEATHKFPQSHAPGPDARNGLSKSKSKPKISHHKFLQAFWTASFAHEIICTVTAILDENFVTFSAHFGFLVVRLIISEAILLLGLYAPGLPKPVKKGEEGEGAGKKIQVPDSSSEEDSDSDSDSDSDDESYGKEKLKKFVSKLPFKAKLKLLKPFLWPANLNARLFVAISLSTLGLDRILKISDNLFKKEIVDSLEFNFGSQNSTTATSQESLFSLAFRWDFVVYSALINSALQITNLIRETLQLKTQNLISSGMQVLLFEKLHNLSLRWHLERRTGSILRKLQSPFGHTTWVLEHFITEIFTGWTDMIISLVYISQVYNERITCLLLVTIVASIGVSLAFHTWDRQYEAWLRQLEAAKLDKAVDSIINFETVKYFSNEEYETKRFLAACEAQQALQLKKHTTQQFTYALRKTVQNFGLLGVQLGCLWMVLRSQGISPGDYVFLTTALFQFANPLSGVLWTFKYVMTSLDELEELQEVLDLNPEIVDEPQATDLALDCGDIEVRNVSFHYIPEKPILHDISFRVKGGETLAIVGESGSGKSTIIKLLFRFYDTISGEIRIDGQNIKSVTQDSLRKAIGVVPQDTVMFNDTILTNLKYGNLTSSIADVVRAAKHACIHDRIVTFKDGYQTKVAERGLKLSGGEKQRLAIARMLLKDPQIFLLDEATSALDTHTERDIRQSLTNACKNRTSIIIAHRLSTVVHADNIIVLQNGRIVESGRHADLMTADGIYSKMWAQQIHTTNSFPN